MKRISKAKCIFFATSAGIALVVVICLTARFAVEMYNRVTTFQTGIHFGEVRHDNWLSMRLGPNATYRVEFIRNDKPVGSFVVNSGSWAEKSDADGLKPIMHLIPDFIAKKGFTAVSLRALRGDGDHIITDIAALTKETISEDTALDYNFINFEIKQLEIKINKRDFRKLEEKREEALAGNKLSINEEVDTAKVKINAEGKNYSADIRLRGATVSRHLGTEKWSLRIDINGDNCIYGMQKFSIHAPINRQNYILDPIINDLYREQNGVAIRYDFADVYINDQYKGVFAVEEFMEKRIIENSRKREGPILRVENRSPFYIRNAIFTPFSVKKNLASEKAIDYVEYAMDLFSRIYRNEIDISEGFDLRLWSSLYVIRDLFAAWHGQMHHNMRYYFNPVTAKLEPIPLDEKAFLSPSYVFESPLITNISQKLYSDNAFITLYKESLEKLGYTFKQFLQRETEFLSQSIIIMSRDTTILGEWNGNNDIYNYLYPNSLLLKRLEELKSIVYNTDLQNPVILDVNQINNMVGINIAHNNRTPIIIEGIFNDNLILDNTNKEKFVRGNKDAVEIKFMKNNIFAFNKVGLRFRHIFTNEMNEISLIPVKSTMSPEIFFGDGWHVPESWGRWTSDHAVLYILPSRNNQDIELVLDVKSMVVPQKLKIKYGKFVSKDIIVDKPGEYIFPLRADFFAESMYSLKLELLFPDAKSLLEQGINPDSRILGIGVGSVRVREATGQR
jgi:hypothetical protein